MKKRGKKYLESLSKIEKGKAYTKEEAIKLAKETSYSKFVGSVEVAVNLNLDTKKADQQLRGTIVLPNGTGKTKKILDIAKGDNATKAKEAGADFVGDVEMLEELE
jgi:large subunit ribosomal protein L1